MQNYSNVKRVGDYFSITNKNEASRLDIDLCSKCAKQKRCKAFKTVSKLSDIHAPIKRCKTFSPYIPFSILDGLDAPQFNTMRVREAWANRLRVGDEVVLYNSVSGTEMGTRKVTELHAGSKETLLKEHAANNHACLTKNIEDPVQYVENILIRSMGKNFYNSADTLSVIYLSKA